MADEITLDNNITTETFEKIFNNKDQRSDVFDTVNEEDLQNIVGRVTRGSEEVHFTYLQKDHAKKFAWVMGGDGLIRFLKQTHIEALRAIGFEDRWIRMKLEDGERFHLGIFYRSDQCVLGTWDGVFSLIDNYYPKPISMKICQYRDAFKQMSFDEIETRARLSYLQGASYFDVDNLSINGCSTDPRFMSEERLLKSEGTLEECRGFLYNQLCVSDLFDGSGFTKDPTGQLHVREYLQLNVPVQELPGFRYLDCDINSADLMPDA